MKDDAVFAEARQGLVQFIGAMLNNNPFEGAAARQLVSAALAEEAVKLSTVNDKIELYSAKPILRAAVAVLESRKRDYEELLGQVENRKPVLAVIAEFRNTIKVINAVIDGAKEGTVSNNG